MLIPTLSEIIKSCGKSNFIGRSREYGSHLDGTLPEALQQFKHSLRWPIDLDTPNIHLAGYFNEPDYNDPDKNSRHRGLDLQVAAGTKVVSPIRGKAVFHQTDPRTTDLMNVGVYSEKLGLLCILAHLDTSGILLPESYPVLRWENQDQVYRDMVVGRVAPWISRLPEQIAVPKDVRKVYGRTYNHLHLECYYIPNKPRTVNEYYQKRAPLNPLLLLRKL